MQRLMAGVMRCPPDCQYEAPLLCPPHCTSWGDGCPLREWHSTNRWAKHHRDRGYWERIDSVVNRTLTFVWQHSQQLPPPLLPPPPSSSSQPQPRLLLLTVTFPHKLQLLKLRHCVHTIRGMPDVLWIVVEDAAEPSPDVAALLADAGVPARHMAIGPTRRGGNAQRNAALQMVRDERLRGVVYMMDDDNAWAPELWAELRSVRPRRVGVLAVRRLVSVPPLCDGRFRAAAAGKVREHLIERPTYDAAGRFAGFEAGWCDASSWSWRQRGPRTFCVDMGGFAFDSALLWPLRGPLWAYRGHGGESELIARMLAADGKPNASAEELQPLGNCGQDVLVFHNEFQMAPNAIHQARASCGADGWGAGDGAERRVPRWPPSVCTAASTRERGCVA